MNLFIGSSGNELIDENTLQKSEVLIKNVAKIPNVNLVFGGYHKGLMKSSFEIFKKEHKKVTGISVDIYKDMTDTTLYDKIIFMENTFDRTKEIYKNSDICLFIPGGIGSLAELVSFMKEKEETKDNKLIIVYNIDFFYTPLFEYLYKLKKMNFIKDEISDYIFISNDIEEIVNKIKEKEKENNG